MCNPKRDIVAFCPESTEWNQKSEIDNLKRGDEHPCVFSMAAYPGVNHVS